MKSSARILLMQKRLLTPIFLGSRLALWLDAADSRTIILDGSTVSEWRDKSINGHIFSQLTASCRPTYTANSPALTFDGVNDFLASNSTSLFNFLHNGQESAVFAVCRFGNTGDDQNAYYTVLSNGGGASADTGFEFSYDDRVPSNNAFNVSVSRSVNASFPIAFRVNNLISPGQWSILSVQVDADNNTPANRAIGKVNGGANITGNASGALPTLGNASFPMHIGAGIYTSAFYGYLLGAISEIFIINGRISVYEQQQLTGYLAHKWRLTANLANNHPFKFRPPYM